MKLNTFALNRYFLDDKSFLFLPFETNLEIKIHGLKFKSWFVLIDVAC